VRILPLLLWEKGEEVESQDRENVGEVNCWDRVLGRKMRTSNIMDSA
jgi:hypothetical protein